MAGLVYVDSAYRPVPQAVNVGIELMTSVGVPVYIVDTEVLVVIGETAIEDETAFVRAGAEGVTTCWALESRKAGKQKVMSVSRNMRWWALWLFMIVTEFISSMVASWEKQAGTTKEGGVSVDKSPSLPCTFPDVLTGREIFIGIF